MVVRLRFEALQLDCFFSVVGAGQQDGNVFAKLGAETEVDERVVEAGRFGKEASEDTGEVRHMEAAGRPHGHHSVWRPRQDEGRTDHYGHLQKTAERVSCRPIRSFTLNLIS